MFVLLAVQDGGPACACTPQISVITSTLEQRKYTSNVKFTTLQVGVGPTRPLIPIFQEEHKESP